MKKSKQNKWIIVGFILLTLATCANIAMTIALMNSTRHDLNLITENDLHLRRELMEKNIIN